MGNIDNRTLVLEKNNKHVQNKMNKSSKRKSLPSMLTNGYLQADGKVS